MRLTTRIALKRLAKIDQELRRGSWPNAHRLATELEVAPRTIQRDIQFLKEDMHAPIAYDPVRHGYHYTQADFRLPFFRISEGEYLALFLAERTLQAYGQSPIAADLVRFFDKIQSLLPDTVSLDVRHLTESYSVRQPQQDLGDARQFAALVKAIERGQQLELVYWTASRDETCRRVVDPYHLASIDGDWYLIGFCHLREDVRIFSPGRIRSLRPTDQTFERPADFRIADYLDAGFRKMRDAGPPRLVRLHFAPPAARYVREKTWHASQTIQNNPDGSLILSLSVNYLGEIKRWVLSFGPDCEVLEPAELKEDIVRDLGITLRQYTAALTGESSPRSEMK